MKEKHLLILVLIFSVTINSLFAQIPTRVVTESSKQAIVNAPVGAAEDVNEEVADNEEEDVEPDTTTVVPEDD